ncbi:uncharacterized protein C8Q71DRAFT_119703 [Rhodofomes roseus]|uniref:C2H2-type domain-containing protein n=1 Tax=Rhodofomes roseus TaxID=34475 RepID=A0ABQ8KCV8_9APHY|nr:uncharacterized protein C8Q71DRAFT_119703 [Rhodofomes roseus]KAH9835433.1 hypothetical protein C8Q71DRAFT_119703 [Rhodofomes roseus]
MDSKLHPKCCQCRVGFEDPVRFDEHLWTFHPEGGCKNCQVHCRTTAHLQQHYDDSPFHPVCEHCGSGFVDTTVLSKHVDCVHLNDGAAYFQQGRPIGLKDDSLRTQSPPSPSDLSSLLGHRSDSLGSDDSTILMLPPCACERNSLHEFVDRPSDPVGSPSRPQSWRNTLTPVTEASSTASRAPSPCPSEWSDYTTEPAVVAATPSVSASMAPSSPQRRQSPSRRTSLFGDASPSEADHRGARTPTTSRASLRSKSSAIPQFPSSMQAVEPVMSGPPPRKAVKARRAQQVRENDRVDVSSARRRVFC